MWFARSFVEITIDMSKDALCFMYHGLDKQTFELMTWLMCIAQDKANIWHKYITKDILPFFKFVFND